ncbi:hypothetical protein MKS88_005425 [Plasmodium brasilianum]|uniref:Uncharacterized protein n=1 Tax=Plasmodium brasilianum TaxID=5824 RepID=A0ACB9Y0T0_PLABR|nr:hypothetical protein MKS88_005425 [Plasmodium brasilianum]
MDVEKSRTTKFMGDNNILKEKTTEIGSYSSKEKAESNSGDVTENYDFMKSCDSINTLFQGGNEIREGELNGIMNCSEERNNVSSSDKNAYYCTSKSDNISINIYTTNRKDLLRYVLNNNSILKTKINLEENISTKRNDKKNFDEIYANDIDRKRSIILSKSNSVRRRNASEECNLNYLKCNKRNEKYNSNEKNVKHACKEYTSYHYHETEKTGLWLVDSVNRLLDNLSDNNSKDFFINNVHSKDMNHYSGNNMTCTNVKGYSKIKWSDYVKFNSLIYYSHILPIYEGIRKMFINFQKEKLEQREKKKKKKKTDLTMFAVSKFSRKNLKNPCNSESYANLFSESMSNGGVGMAQNRDNTTDNGNGIDSGDNSGGGNDDNNNGYDDDYGYYAFSNYFIQLVRQVRDKYNEFCDTIGEKLENVDKENYSFKEYCIIVSKIFVTHILNMIPFYELPLFLNNMLNSFNACIQYENNESVKEVDLTNSYNIDTHNRIETLYNLPVNFSNSVTNLNTTIRLNCGEQNKPTIVVSGTCEFSYNDINQNLLRRCATDTHENRHKMNIQLNRANRENSNFLDSILPERRNSLTSIFSNLPKYMKTYANSRSKLNNFVSIKRVSKLKKVNKKAHLNEDLPLDSNKSTYIYSKDIKSNTDINIETIEGDKENVDDHLAKKPSTSFSLYSDSFNITNSDNYCSVKSLPLNGFTKLGNSLKHQKSQEDSVEFLECKGN